MAVQALLGADDEHDLATPCRRSAGRSCPSPCRRRRDSSSCLGAVARHQDAAAAGGADDEAALHQLGHDQHAPGLGHHLSGVGKILAVQHLARGCPGMDRPATGAWRRRGRHGGEKGRGNAAAVPDRTVRRSSFIFCSFGSRPTPGKRLGGHEQPNHTTFRGELQALDRGGHGAGRSFMIERQARGHQDHPVGPLGHAHVEPALGIAEGAAERRLGHDAQAHLVADEHHRRGAARRAPAAGRRSPRRDRRRHASGWRARASGNRPAPAGRASARRSQRLGELQRLLDRGPADAAARAMGHDAGRHLDVARLGGGDVDRGPRRRAEQRAGRQASRRRCSCPTARRPAPA